MFPFSLKGIGLCSRISKLAFGLEGDTSIPHVPGCINSRCFFLSNFTGPVFRQSTKSLIAAGTQQQPDRGQQDRPFAGGEDFYSAASSRRGNMQARRCFQPGSIFPVSLISWSLMQSVFSYPEAIYWYICGDCCGFCLANEVFVCVCASTLQKKPPIYHACVDIASSAA